MIHVLVADDHQLFRQGLSALLMGAKDIEIIGQARDGQEAMELAERLQPDVILMDLEMPRVNGFVATERLTAQGHSARILVLSMRTDEKDVRAAAHSGAIGYLIKNCSRDELVAGVRSAYAGNPACSPEIAAVFSREGHGA
jgi:DNA-binding NarL/FixJ family response regulator